MVLSLYFYGCFVSLWVVVRCGTFFSRCVFVRVCAWEAVGEGFVCTRLGWWVGGWCLGVGIWRCR